MDTSGFSQVGRYGSLSLMKRQEPDTVVTTFGIDTEELSFGRDPSCSVRLYYPDVGLTHCKITFEERKAFLVVLGSTGLIVDGCKVYPNRAVGAQPTTIPLSNNSEIEIHNKRFRFSYPPKEIRAALFATPAPHNRKLRLSMINSAQVFSPCPSKDPRENLRILRSPMRNAFRSPMKSSPLPQPPMMSPQLGGGENEGNEEEAIILVDGHHPRVVEEDKDLVILEDVEVPILQPVFQIQPPQTPQRRRSQSLHRAVLIRSAQRMVLEHERQYRQEEQEREEEMEVLDTIAGGDMDSDEDSVDHQECDELPPSDEETDEEEQPEEDVHGQRKPLWRKSLEKLWLFRGSSPTEPTTADEEAVEQEGQQNPEEKSQDETYEAHDQPRPLPSLPQTTPIRRPLNSFMTPQAARAKPPLFDRGQSVEPSRGRLGGGPPSRYSLGGEARRIPLEPVWRVQDIVVPLKEEPESNALPRDGAPGSPIAPRQAKDLQASPVRGRPEVSVEERKAIQERRRSAVRNVDSYFPGGIPGMSPSKPSTSTTKPAPHDTRNPFWPVSPTKPASPVKDIERRLSTDEESEQLDTRSLLERMRDTVEGMKKRRSTLGLMGTSPVKPTADSGAFDHMEKAPLPPTWLDGEEVTGTEDHKHTITVEKPFSLLQFSPTSDIATKVQLLHESQDDREPHEPIARGIDKKPLLTPSIVEGIVADEEPQSNAEAVPNNKLASSDSDTPQLEVSPKFSRVKDRSPHPIAEAAAPTAPRRTRSTKTESEHSNETNGEAVIPAPNRTRRRAARAEQQSAPAPVPAPTRRTHKVITEPLVHHELEIQESTKLEEPAPVIKRQAKKSTAVEKEVKISAPQTTRSRSRPPRATATDEDEGNGAKRSAGRAHGIKVAPTELDNGNGDDPLDSLNIPEQIEGHEPRIANKRQTKSQRSRTTIKQEGPEISKTTATKAGRNAAPATATKTPAQTRNRARKTPATAPAAVQVDVDKENTPGSRPSAGSARKDAAEDAEEGVVVRIKSTRVTRTRAVKQEEVGNAETRPPVGARAVRSTRLRTKTS